MLHYATFHQNLHCLKIILIKEPLVYEGLNVDTMSGVIPSRISSKSSGGILRKF